MVILLVSSVVVSSADLCVVFFLMMIRLYRIIICVPLARIYCDYAGRRRGIARGVLPRKLDLLLL